MPFFLTIRFGHTNATYHLSSTQGAILISAFYMPYLLLQKFAQSSPLMRHYALIMESKMDTDNGAINLTDANLSNLKPDHLRFTSFCKEFYGYR